MKKVVIVMIRTIILCGLLFSTSQAQQPDPQKVDAYLKAIEDAKKKVNEFKEAIKSRDPVRIKKADLAIQSDPAAVKELNKEHNFVKKKFVDTTDVIQSETMGHIKERVAKKYNVDPKDVNIKKFTNPSNEIKAGHDWDVTVSIKGKDIPYGEVKQIVHESYFEAAGGTKVYPHSNAETFAEDHHVEVTSEHHGEAYEGGKKYIENPEKYKVKDPERLSKTIEHKSHLDQEKAAILAEDNLLSSEVYRGEQARQYTKQYDKHIKPRIEEMGGMIPENVKEGTKILEKIGKHDAELGRIYTPADADAALAKLGKHGETIESIIKKGSAQVESAQKLKAFTKQRTLGTTGKKIMAAGYKAVNVTIIAGMAYFMGKDGVYHALKNVTADETYFQFLVDVYKEAAWHGSGLGYAFEEAQAEELELWKREIERGEPSDRMRKQITITIGKTIVYFGRDIVVGTLTLPYVFLEYLIGFEDAEKREQYSKAFLAEVRRQIKSKKEFEKALDLANKEGIAYKDQQMYFDCLCRNCGGSLGGFFRPEFNGPGYGPCQCNGPLSIWKTPISNSGDQRDTCKENIRQMNNRISDARMDELHKLAIAENAKSVQKELQEVRHLSQKDKSLIKAAKLFSDIKELLYPKDRKSLEEQLIKKLSVSTHPDISQGKINKAIKTLELAKDLTKENSFNNKQLANQISKLQKWKKTWEEIKKNSFPKIYEDMQNHHIISAKKGLQHIDPTRLGAPWSSQGLASTEDPEYLSLKEALAKKEKEYQEALSNTKINAKKFMNNREPQNAIDILTKFLNSWEHNPYTRVPVEKMLSQAKILLRNAQKEALAQKINDIKKAAQATAEAQKQKEELAAKVRKIKEEAKIRHNGESQKLNNHSTTAVLENSKNTGGYWKMTNIKGSIGRNCSPKEVYNDYYL